ncbi:cardiac phospholamban isoform X1 [Syngnathus typhle]|uniref:cardiac phospholamban isoform X1 n=2 Tax=Syngnathus TaxID=103719 RepID=UPI002A6B38EF|nr:cardiac phospholamban isoform X1 [Syngnathus typhle]
MRKTRQLYKEREFSSLPKSVLQAQHHRETSMMERVQHITKSAMRRASQIEVTPQAKRNLQELFINFTLLLICLLLIYIIVLLSS